jgi:hypothetical protein
MVIATHSTLAARISRALAHIFEDDCREFPARVQQLVK